MKHPERLEDYLDHIAEAITRATDYARPLQSIKELEQNQLVQDAIVRNIEIIGEAATNINRVAPDFVTAHPQFPWAQMRRMRNIVIHRYFAVDLTVLWTTVTDVLPRLKEQIGELRREPDSDTLDKSPRPGRRDDNRAHRRNREVNHLDP
jgi:uncharacterized protein with HEPN domain